MFASAAQLSKNTYPILCPMPVKARYAMVFDVETTGLLPKVDPVTKSQPTLDYFPHIIQFSWVVYDLATNMIDKRCNYYIRLPKNVLVTNEITDLTGITQDMCNAGVDLVEVLTEFCETYTKCDFAVAHNLQFDATVILAEMTRHSNKLGKFADVDIFSLKYTETHQIWLYCTMSASKDVCSLWMEYTPKPAIVIENTGSLEIIRIPSPHDDELFRPPTPSEEPDLSQSKSLKQSSSFQVTKGLTAKVPKPRMFKKFPKLSETHNYLFGYVPESLHNAMVDVLVCLRCFLKLRCGYSMSNRKFELLWASRRMQ